MFLEEITFTSRSCSEHTCNHYSLQSRVTRLGGKTPKLSAVLSSIALPWRSVSRHFSRNQIARMILDDNAGRSISIDSRMISRKRDRSGLSIIARNAVPRHGTTAFRLSNLAANLRDDPAIVGRLFNEAI